PAGSYSISHDTCLRYGPASKRSLASKCVTGNDSSPRPIRAAMSEGFSPMRTSLIGCPARANTTPMRKVFAGLACLGTGLASATSVRRIELPELVQRSDHVLLATVTKVDMVDANGKQVTYRAARTGPGSRNTIRFHLEVEEVIHTTAPQPPK